MVKAATKKPVTTTSGVVESEIKQLSVVWAARQQFLVATFNLTWRLAISVIVPIVAGVKLDEYFELSPLLTITGMILAAAAGSAAVWATVREVSRKQNQPASHKKTNNRLNHA